MTDEMSEPTSDPCLCTQLPTPHTIRECNQAAASDEAGPPDKPPGACRFSDCPTTATNETQVAITDDELTPVALCGPHAGMVRRGRFPESLRGTALASDGELVVGLPAQDESGEPEQVTVPVFVPVHPADGPTPVFVRAQPGPNGGVVTVETPLHPGELQVYSTGAAALLIRQLQGALREATVMPIPPPHPMAEAPIVGGP